MNKVLAKTIVATGILIVVLLFIFLFYKILVSEKRGDELRVSFLNIGQGDSSLIQTMDGKNILIDGGPDDSVIFELSKELSWFDRTIDLMILTHPHADHISGLTEVIERYDVRKILYTGVPHSSPTYIHWLKLVQEKKIPITIISKSQTIELTEDCFIEILYPISSLLNLDVSNLNNTSVVLKLVHGETKFLFTGDIESETESELLRSGIDLSADVLKVAHHGSDTSTSLEFLKAVRPEFAVMQVGEDNKFNHPSIRILKRLERMNVEIFRNDIDGTVRFKSDGKNIFLKTL